MMNKGFYHRLIERIEQKKSHIMVGLDPRLDRIPSFFKEAAIEKHGKSFKAAGEVLLGFCKRVLDAVAPYTAMIKPQMAFFEQYGIDGLQALSEIIKYAHNLDLLVLLDGKRNDIGSTAMAYSSAYLGEVELFDEHVKPQLEADALTVNAYLGYDGIQPFIKDCNHFSKGIFVLVRTSNQSAGDLQDLVVQGGERLFLELAKLVEKYSEESAIQHGYANPGIVVGATYPEDAAELRKRLNRAYFLVPGYGAQGATAKDVVKCFNKDGYGALINASRSIIYAYRDDYHSPDAFEEVISQAASFMAQDINQALGCWK